MAKIEVTEEQKKILRGKGYVVKAPYDHSYNRRSFWDPHEDEKGNVMGWTRPLPADTLRMNRYLAKGFLLQDPQGHTSPPPGHFGRAKPMVSPGRKTVSGKKVVDAPHTAQGLPCPFCEQVFPDKDSLINHMIYHRSTKAKKSAKKSKRGGAISSEKKSAISTKKEEN